MGVVGKIRKPKKAKAEDKEKSKSVKKPSTGKRKFADFLKSLGHSAPYRERITKLLVFAGIKKSSPLTYIGKLVLFSAILAVGTLLISILYVSLIYSIIAAVSMFFGIQLLNIVYLNLKADARSSSIERVLPDALQLISANIRAGMTLNRAIWLSARPEFGAVEDEIRRVGSETLAGKTIEDALKEMPERVDSKILDRAVKLIVEGMKSGGEMAGLLDATSEDIRISKVIRDEIKSSVMMYSMFIIFASVIGAPALFAISIYFVQTTSSLWAGQSVEEYSQLQSGFLTPSAPVITADDLLIFSVVMIIIGTAFGALLISLIQSGKAQRGIRLILPLTGAGLIIFLISRVVVSTLLGGLIAI